jgi:hypothetical protein
MRRCFSPEIHEPWKTVEKNARVAHQTISAPSFGAVRCDKPDDIFTSAGKARFEGRLKFKIDCAATLAYLTG